MATIVLRREGSDDVIREIDEVDPAVPQYIEISKDQAEVFHFQDAYDPATGNAIYAHVGSADRHYPNITGAR